MLSIHVIRLLGQVMLTWKYAHNAVSLYSIRSSRQDKCHEHQDSRTESRFAGTFIHVMSMQRFSFCLSIIAEPKYVCRRRTGHVPRFHFNPRKPGDCKVKGSLKMTRMFCHKSPTSSETIRQDLPAPLRIHGQGHSERAAEDSSDHFSLDSTSEEVNLVRMNTVDKTR